MNIITNSFKSHIDYVILLRKIAHYFETKINDQVNDSLSDINNSRLGENEVVLKIDIESAIRLKNPFNELEPPNAFVLLKIPYSNSAPSEIRTQTI